MGRERSAVVCAFAPSTHHLCVVGIEGLFIQGEFLRAQRLVQLDHLRKLNKQAGQEAAELRGGRT